MSLMMMTHDLSSGGGIGTQGLCIYTNVLTMCLAPAALLTKWIADGSRRARLGFGEFCGANTPSSGNEREKNKVFPLHCCHLEKRRVHFFQL